MRINLGRSLVVSGLLLLTVSAANAAEGIVWVKSFAVAQQQSKATHKLIMVDFYTGWCGWCKKLDADTYTNKGIIQLSGQVIPVKLDAEKGEGINAARKYGVTGFPTILFINEIGKVEDTIGGYMPPADFNQKMTEALTVHDLPNIEARYKSNPNDVPTVGKLVAVYAAKGDVTQSSAMLAHLEKLDPHSSKGMLPKSYNALADCYQSKNNFGQAIPLFRKAISVGKDPHDVVYAYTSIASCYLSQKKTNEALREFKAAAAVPNCPPEIKSRVNQAIAELTQSRGQL